MTRVRRYVTFNEPFSVWEDITSWCFTQFGLPGDKAEWNYLTDGDWMDFYFQDSKSAELFILKWM